MGNTCGCGDKGDLEQEVRSDPVSHSVLTAVNLRLLTIQSRNSTIVANF